MHQSIILGLGLGLGLAVCGRAPAQTPPTPAPALVLTLQEAMERARANSPQLLSANIAALVAHEDTRQAKAALLPTAAGFSQYIYTQPNGTPTGTYISNDGAHVYNDQLQVHGDLYAPSKMADYHKAQLAEAVSRAKAEIAARGLIATVVGNYYAMVSAKRKYANAQQSLREAQTFADITEKLERGGESAHYDTVKAQTQLLDRQRDVQESQLSMDKARLSFSVLLFPDFRQDFAVADDLDSTPTLPAFAEIQSMASHNSPDIRAAQATLQQQQFELKSVRAELLPSLSFDYFWGLNSNQFAVHDPEGRNNLGSSAQAQVNIPLWNWGITKSRMKQSELRIQQARNDLTLTQRQLLADLNQFYLEAGASSSQIASLRRSLELSAEALRLTMLRYQGGEGSVLEVVDAQTTTVGARNAYEDGMVRYRLAVANLQTLTGAF
jgi:outer membrane protein TolC